MNKKQMEKWVKALRSGKYKQTFGTLRKESEKGKYLGNCCLGVLAEINGFGPKEIREYKVLDGGMGGVCGLKHGVGNLSDENNMLIPITIGTKEYRSLADANDCGVSFRRIASWIEKHYKEL